MGYLHDYIDFVENKTFSELPFNEVDGIMRKLIEDCWKQEPRERLKMSQVCKRLKKIYEEEYGGELDEDDDDEKKHSKKDKKKNKEYER